MRKVSSIPFGTSETGQNDLKQDNFVKFGEVEFISKNITENETWVHLNEKTIETMQASILPIKLRIEG